MSRPALRTVVADDEPQARRSLRLALEGMPGVAVVAECAGGAEAIETIRREEPDVAFLDISMPEVDGFDVAESLDADARPALVFVTAHEAWALRAFEVAAIDYVLKPFDDQRIAEAVRRARNRFDAGPLDVAALRDALGRAPDARPFASRFLVREGSSARFVQVDDVIWIEADGKFVKLHTREGVHRVRLKLSEVVERLDPALFLRVHRSHVVRLDCVEEIHPWFRGDYVVRLNTGAEVRVSRTHQARLLRKLS